MAEIGIKERVLDVAERLFAENGLKETSVRDITAAADVHLAAVNYHFGSKEGLIRAVIARRAEPLNRERIRLLEAYEAQGNGAPVPLEQILHALFAPSVQLCLEHRDFMRLAGRMLFEPDRELHRVLLSHFVDVFQRFKSALVRGPLRDVPECELFWRMHFLIGAMIHTWANHHDLEWLSGGLCTFANEQEMIGRLITFCAAGLRAPVATPSGVAA
jgi:AcrR family transcriptional regulator